VGFYLDCIRAGVEFHVWHPACYRLRVDAEQPVIQPQGSTDGLGALRGFGMTSRVV
jgi:hypothetical protein